MWIRQGHGGTRNLSQPGSNEQGEDQRLKGIFQPKSELQAVFPAENRWSPEKIEKKGLHWNCKDFPAEIETSSGFSGRNLVISKKKGLHWNCEGFSGRKQVTSKKKKVFINAMKSDVSPQKTPIWASICTPVAPSLCKFLRGTVLAWGCTIFVWGAQAVIWGGTAPVCPPWRLVWFKTIIFWG